MGGRAAGGTDESIRRAFEPNYDAYTIASRDSEVCFDRAVAESIGAPSVPFDHAMVRGGRVQGTWRRVSVKGGLTARVPAAPAG